MCVYGVAPAKADRVLADRRYWALGHLIALHAYPLGDLLWTPIGVFGGFCQNVVWYDYYDMSNFSQMFSQMDITIYIYRNHGGINII